MSGSKTLALIFIFFVVVFLACKQEPDDVVVVDPPADTSVSFDLNQLPYEKLSDYRFFINELKELVPNDRVIPYEPITPLFSDYAHKSRFIWMPTGVSASYVNDHDILDFPNGTVMIKSFYYDHVIPNDGRKILETRLIYKKDDAWFFADYTWNEEQTEAFFTLEGSNVPVNYLSDDGEERFVNFRIPAESECYTCHKLNDKAIPIGPKPQNLNSDYLYEDGLKNQLQKWIEVGYLQGPLPEDIVTVGDWTDETLPIEERVRAYVDMNCAHCHREGSHCAYRPMRFAYSETTIPENLGICVEPQEFIQEQITHVISRGNSLRSALFYRINTNEVQWRMPLMGRTVIHQEAVDLFEEYIEAMSPPCP